MTGRKNPKEKNFEVNRRGPEFAGAFEPVAGNSAYSGLKWAKVVKLVPFFASIGAGFIMYTAGEEMKSRDLVMPTPSPRPRIVQTYTPPSTPPAPPAEPPAEVTPSATPSPTPTPTPSPTPTPAPPPNLPAAPQEPEVTPTPEPEETPEPTPTPTPEETPEPTPTPTPEETPEPTPTPTPTPAEPSFTSTKFEDRGDGVVEVSYTIQVDSVNGEDGQAVLMVMDKETGEFRQADGDEATRDYTGDWTGEWTVPSDTEPDGLRTEIPYEEGHYGSINRMKVRFNYTNADGESDYIDSTEIAVCSGTFVSFDGSMLGGSGFSVSFKIDTDILDDPSAVTCTSATVEINGTERQLSASISDGVLTVGGLFEEILADGETIESMGPVKVTVNYNDGVADWTIETEGEVDRSPEIFFDSIYIGSRDGSAGGLRRALIEYSIVDNGALVSGSAVTLRQGGNEKTWENEGSGDFTINDSIASEGLYYAEGMEAELTIWYSLDNGETWTEKSETSTSMTLCDCYLDVTIDEAYSEGGDGLQISGTFTLKPVNENDPFTYKAKVSSDAGVEWLPEDPEETPHWADLYFDGIEDEAYLITSGESISFEAMSAPPEVSTAPTGFRLYLETTYVEGEMGGETYGYEGTVSGSAEGRLPDPTEASVTVSGGKGTISGGQLTASGTATVTFDASKDIATGESDAIYVNWFDSAGNLLPYPDGYTELESGVNLSQTGSSGTQLSFTYSFSGVDVPENATQFNVEISFVLYDSGGDWSDWAAGESSNAALYLATPFGDEGSFATGEDLIGFYGTVPYNDINYDVEEMQNVVLHFVSEGSEVGTLSVVPYSSSEGLAGFSFSVEEDFPGRYADYIYITGSYNGLPFEASPSYMITVTN